MRKPKRGGRRCFSGETELYMPLRLKRRTDNGAISKSDIHLPSSSLFSNTSKKNGSTTAKNISFIATLHNIFTSTNSLLLVQKVRIGYLRVASMLQTMIYSLYFAVLPGRLSINSRRSSIKLRIKRLAGQYTFLGFIGSSIPE